MASYSVPGAEAVHRRRQLRDGTGREVALVDYQRFNFCENVELESLTIVHFFT